MIFVDAPVSARACAHWSLICVLNMKTLQSGGTILSSGICASKNGPVTFTITGNDGRVVND